MQATEIGFHPMVDSPAAGDCGELKILHAAASTDFCVTRDCRIVHHPVHGRKCLELGKDHWIPVVSWVRLHPERHVPEGPGENGEPVALDGFQELDSSEKVVWVEKPRHEG